MKFLNQTFIYVISRFIILCILSQLLACSNFSDQYYSSNQTEDALNNTGIFSRGTEFYIGFPQNYNNENTTLLMHMTGTHDTSGIINIPALNFNDSFTITANEITTVEIPHQILSSSNDTIENYSIHVTAIEAITIYCVNKLNYTSDSFLALPVKSLAREYYVMSYYSSSNAESQSLFMIIATENNTAIEITPTSDAGIRSSGVPFIINMNAGETYQLKATGSLTDLTGTSINAGKPIAVLSGSTLTSIPYDIAAQDYIIDFIPPASSWGTRFYIPCNSIPPASDQAMPFTIRIHAAYSNTNISINNDNYTLNSSGDFYEQDSSSSMVINSDKPVLVAKFLHSSASISAANNYGDPSMIIIQPEIRFMDNYTFCTPHAAFDRNFISLVVPTADLPDLLLDNISINTSLFHEIDDYYSGAYIPVTPGAHSITGTNNFGLTIFGFKEYESYGMSGG